LLLLTYATFVLKPGHPWKEKSESVAEGISQVGSMIRRQEFRRLGEQRRNRCEWTTAVYEAQSKRATVGSEYDLPACPSFCCSFGGDKKRQGTGAQAELEAARKIQEVMLPRQIGSTPSQKNCLDPKYRSELRIGWRLEVWQLAGAYRHERSPDEVEKGTPPETARFIG
jgi:hypothetical protein